jgi:hypothetical protein
MLHDPSGAAQAGVAGVTFAIYKDQQGGAPLWMETQTVAADKTGHYTAQLGSTRSDGLPVDLFASGEARWLGVQVSGQAEQPRVLLLSVPYALKAGDAETVGGLPPSAFVLAAPASGPVSATGSTTTPASSDGASVPPPATITGAGTLNFVPLFTGAATIGNSALFQSGASPTAKIGINTSVPATTLDVKGAGTFRGALTLPATGPATAVAGKASQPLNLVASSFNSTAGTPLNQTFRLQSEPVGNNTAATSGTLNLLYASGANAAAETGLKIASNGQIAFAAGQTFPGAGTGTVKSVGLAAPASDFAVSGSPVTGTGTLNLAWKVAPTSADTANAIVKRDGTGSFNVTNITGTGTFSTSTGKQFGISASTSFDGGYGVRGQAAPANGTKLSTGVFGDSYSPGSFSSGVLGQDENALGSGGVTTGVRGSSSNPVGIGVLGLNAPFGLSDSFSKLAGFQRIGVWGDAESGGVGYVAIGVMATSDTGAGIYATNGSGAATSAVVAQGGNGAASTILNGAPAISAFGGNAGCCDSGGNGGHGGNGIDGTGGIGVGNVQGTPEPGVGGNFVGGNPQNCIGTPCGGDGISAHPGRGSDGKDGGAAAFFYGDVFVSGALSAGTKDFRIDHPLDPANKYLLHASVESNEMVNVYTGNADLDADGSATVELPNWFEAVNGDYRYQLTALGKPGPGLFIAQKISSNRFTISGGSPGGEVSWQVTGVRRDPYARANPLVVEETKSAREKGFYIHPALYGAPEEKQIEWARHPAMMLKMKENRGKQLAGMPPIVAVQPKPSH